MITMNRTGVQSYQATVNGQVWSVNAIAGTWYVAKDMVLFAETFTGFRPARDFVESTVIAEQNAAQDAAVATGTMPCYDLSCLTAQGPECTCGCIGAGHGLAFTGAVKF